MSTIGLEGRTPEELPLPGETLAEELEEWGMSEEDLADRVNCHVNYIHDVIVGERPISEWFANSLGHVFGASADFWIGLQRAYDEDLAWLKEHQK